MLLSILSENEVTISVNYSGGGQGLKKRMYHIFLLASKGTAAFKPPSETKKALGPISTIPTPSSLPSSSVPLSYDNTAAYTNLLQETFLDYKIISENIHSLEEALDSGTIRLRKSPFTGMQLDPVVTPYRIGPLTRGQITRNLHQARRHGLLCRRTLPTNIHGAREGTRRC